LGSQRRSSQDDIEACHEGGTWKNKHESIGPASGAGDTMRVIDPGFVPGHHVLKGDELGYFQFCGSTERLVFRHAVIDKFALTALRQPQNPKAPLVRLRSKLGSRDGPGLGPGDR
jgi:hypothetical protein